MNGILDDNEPLEQTTRLQRMDKSLDEPAGSTIILMAGLFFTILYLGFFASLAIMVNQ